MICSFQLFYNIYSFISCSAKLILVHIMILCQGVSRALVENSRTLRLPNHLHERLGLIRNAKLRLEEKGVTPSVDVSWLLNCDQKKGTLINSITVFFFFLQPFILFLLTSCLPHFQRIAEYLNMSQKKVRNATEVLTVHELFLVCGHLCNYSFHNSPYTVSICRQLARSSHLIGRHSPL